LALIGSADRTAADAREGNMMSFVPATPPTSLNPWVRILGALEKKLNRQSFDTWLKPTRFSHISGKKLFVRIPSHATRTLASSTGL